MKKYSKADRRRIAGEHTRLSEQAQADVKYLREVAKDPENDARRRNGAWDTAALRSRQAGYHAVQADLWTKSANIMNTMEQF